MAKFFKRALKGIAAFSLGGVTGLAALALKKGIQKRKAKKAEQRSIDTLKAEKLLTGENQYYNAEMNKTKAKTRALFSKIKIANLHINRGASRKEGLNRAGLSEYDVNKPKELYL